jgi:hypothetical protein
LDYKDMQLNSKEKLFEDIKPLVNSPYWKKLQDLLDQLISEKRDSLERVTNFEEVMRIRGCIESLREVKELDDAIKLFDEATKPQFRDREPKLYDQAN